MQIYRHMDIATAKPTVYERSLLAHHLIDIRDPDEEFSAGMFTELARDAISKVLARRRIPVVVGGTGLYIKTLIYGLIPAPPGSPDLRRYLRVLFQQKGDSYLRGMLKRLDPVSAEKIAPNDSVRVLRCLEIIFLTGMKPSSLQSRHAFADPVYDARIACIMPERDELYRAINSRVHTMVDLGLVDETRTLVGMGYDPSLRSMQTLAYKHVIRYLDSDLPLDEAISNIQRDTRHYAKRQITWIKGHYEAGSYYNTIDQAFPVICRWIEQGRGSSRL